MIVNEEIWLSRTDHLEESVVFVTRLLPLLALSCVALDAELYKGISIRLWQKEVRVQQKRQQNEGESRVTVKPSSKVYDLTEPCTWTSTKLHTDSTRQPSGRSGGLLPSTSSAQ